MSTIETLIKGENWETARQAIQIKLRHDPHNHWLLTRLSLTYYEQRDYKRALNISKRALAIVPQCPLVLWDYAGCLAMLEKHTLAIKLYKKLISRGIESIAFDTCGEGVAWARGLIADCHYRIAQCYLANNNKKKTISHLTAHLGLRGPGCRSIYSFKKIKKELYILKSKADINRETRKSIL